MKNITLSVDDETYRQARLLAAKREQSVSALVRDLINESAVNPGTNPAPMVREPRAHYIAKTAAKSRIAAAPAPKQNALRTQATAKEPAKEMSFLQFMRASPLYGLDIDLTRDKSLPRDFRFDE